MMCPNCDGGNVVQLNKVGEAIHKSEQRLDCFLNYVFYKCPHCEGHFLTVSEPIKYKRIYSENL